MPRTVDHRERRAELADAMLRIAGREGLGAVSMRSVALEAGVSLRGVQYYFGTKAELLRAALEELEARSTDRWLARRRRLGAESGPRAMLRAFLEEALPTDPESRALVRAFHSYTELYLSDPAFSSKPPKAGPDRLEGEIEAILIEAERDGALAVDDPAAEAATLLSLGHGLTTSVLIGQRPAAEAAAIWDRHLDLVLR